MIYLNKTTAVQVVVIPRNGGRLPYHKPDYIVDAPKDGKTYGRKDGTWVENQGGTSDTYTKAQSDARFAPKSNTYTKTEVDTKLSGKANSADVYSKQDVDTKLSGKANSSDVYTKTEMRGELARKADDTEVVHKAGEETISGEKTFTAGIKTGVVNIPTTNDGVTIAAYDVDEDNGKVSIIGDAGSFTLEVERDPLSNMEVATKAYADRVASGKMSWCGLSCDGEKITKEGETTALTFAQVKALVDDPTQFVALKYGDIFWLLPQYDDLGGAIVFTGVSLLSEQGDVWRVAINEQNEISDYSIAIENQYLKTNDLTKETIGSFKTYPTTQAVNAKLGQLEEIIGTDEKKDVGELSSWNDGRITGMTSTSVTTDTRTDFEWIRVPISNYEKFETDKPYNVFSGMPSCYFIVVCDEGGVPKTNVSRDNYAATRSWFIRDESKWGININALKDAVPSATILYFCVYKEQGIKWYAIAEGKGMKESIAELEVRATVLEDKVKELSDASTKEHVNILELEHTIVEDGIRCDGQSGGNVYKRSSGGMTKTIKVDVNDCPMALIKFASNYKKSWAGSYYICSFAEENDKYIAGIAAARDARGFNYDGNILTIDVALYKMLNPTLRYIYICMEYANEVDVIATSANITSASPELVLPKRSIGIIGHEWNMYYDNIIDGLTDDYDVVVYTSSNISNILMLEKCLRITPTTSGTYTVYVEVCSKKTRACVSIASFEFKVIADTRVTGKKMLCIGDSLTDAGVYTAEIQHNLSNGGIVSLGTITDTVEIGGVQLTASNEGRGGWSSWDYTRSVTSYRTDRDNPFWDGEKFNFTYYMQQQGYSGVDVVVIGLGTNQLDNIGTGIEALKEMIASIHEYNANIPIIVSLITPPAKQDGCGRHVAMQSSAVTKYKELQEIRRYMAELGSIDNLSFAELYFNLDTENDFDEVSLPASSRNPKVVSYQDNNVHPSAYGYLKFADVYYNNILYQLTK